MDKRTHWENIYKAKSPKDVSWYSPHLAKSLELILGLGLPKDAEIIDIGGGASTLLDDLSAKGFKNITVLDISGEALKVSKDRLHLPGGDGIEAGFVFADVAGRTRSADR